MEATQPQATPPVEQGSVVKKSKIHIDGQWWAFLRYNYEL
jgi:hypothetical protein